MPSRLIPLIFLASLFVSGCGDSNDTASSSSGKPTIYVPVPPYAGLAEAIGGEFFEVETIASINDDPHTYSPTPQELVGLSSALLYFTADLPFESVLVEKLESSSSEVTIVSLVDSLERRTFLEGEHDCELEDDGEVFVYTAEDLKRDQENEHELNEDHDHDHHGHDDHHHDHDHGHGELDPHVWLSPAHLVEQVNILKSTLAAELDSSEDIEKLESNAAALVAEIRQTDRKLAEQLAPLRGTSFYVYHGAFGYLADAYGLTQVPVEVNGRSPEPKQLADLVEQAKHEGVKVIFVQPQFDPSSAEALSQSIGGTVLSIDPLAEDVIANLSDIASKLQLAAAPQ